MQKLSVLRRALFILLLVLLPLGHASATDTLPPGLIMSEVKIKNTSSTQTDEFIEFYNNGFTSILLSDYFLEYFNVYDPLSETATTHKGPFALPAITMPTDSVVTLAVTPGKVAGSSQLASITSLKDSEGQLRLLKPVPLISPAQYTLVDQVAWKDSAPLPTNVYNVPSVASHSLQRATHTTPAVFDDAWVDDVASPGSALLIPLPADDPPDSTDPIPDPPTSDPATDDSSSPAAPVEDPTFLPLQLTELLPNPAAPQTDSNDEFVELYNPNSEAIDLQGYVVQTGTSFSYSYSINEGSIPAHGFITYTSGSTNLSLANSGGKARLLDVNGVTVSEVAYETAADGQAWALVGGAWQWTTTPTPGAENILTTPEVKETARKSTTKSTKATTTKSTTAKTASVKAASTKKTTVSTAKEDFADAEEPAPVHPAILAGGGFSALVYAGYEYHADVVSKIYQFRKYRAVRRATRT